jgi:hypothetical protein
MRVIRPVRIGLHPATRTVFVIVPSLVGRTTMVTVALAPLFDVPKSQVTVPPHESTTAPLRGCG